METFCFSCKKKKENAPNKNSSVRRTRQNGLRVY